MSGQIEDDVAAIAAIDAIPAILEVICRTTGMGFAAVARVTEDRWVACAVRDEISFGLAPGGELTIETTICDDIRQSGRAVIIDHVAEDPNFCGHHTPAMYGFQSYISIPILRADKSFFGTLCAIDPNPAKVSRTEIVRMFELFAQLIAFHLDAHERVSDSTAQLLYAQQNADLRDRFIATLGHDLRNPLASIDAGLSRLDREKLSSTGKTVVELMKQSAKRMSHHIEQVLDIARARLGGGISVQLDAPAPLAPALQHVVDEFRVTEPNREIRTSFHINRPVKADAMKLARLLSNLVGNAITYGADDRPVRVGAETRGDAFELWVANEGAPIAPELAANLFQPFVRGDSSNPHPGLGLGLYISTEIAKAHGGTLTLASDETETRFTFRMHLS